MSPISKYTLRPFDPYNLIDSPNPKLKHPSATERGFIGFILSNIIDSQLSLVETSPSHETYTAYLKELDLKLRNAKWFRPACLLLLLLSASCILDSMVAKQKI